MSRIRLQHPRYVKPQSEGPTFDDQVARFAEATLKQFRSSARGYSLFHMFFFLLALVEIVSFLLFFSFFMRTTILAFSLAGFFLTAFSYFILLFYVQAKKPIQFQALKDRFVARCRQILPYPEGSAKHHLSLAHALYTLVSDFHSQEYFYYPTPRRLETISNIIQKFSSWSHWKDLHKMKELLVKVAIHEHIALIKEAPRDLEAHASLAQAYVLLSKLYLNPRKLNPDVDLPWVPAEYDSDEMLAKFNQAGARALEEFKILDHLAPNDPWVQTQLASLYHDLKMAKEEIATLEKLLTLAPRDRDLLLRLGVLYFQEGHHASGLTLYEKLLQEEDPRAETLIAHYGTLSLDEDE